MNVKHVVLSETSQTHTTLLDLSYGKARKTERVKYTKVG